MQALGAKSGFIVAPILVAVIIGAALVGVLALTTGDQSSGGNETNRTLATNIIGQGSNLSTVMQRAVASGLDPDEITFNEPPSLSTDFYAIARLEGPSPLGSAMSHGYAGNNRWQYTRGVRITGVGQSATQPEIAAVVVGLKLGVCRHINFVLYGMDIDDPDNPYDGGAATAADWQAGFIEGAATINLTGVAALENRREGCVRTSDGVNVFYRVIAEQ